MFIIAGVSVFRICCGNTEWFIVSRYLTIRAHYTLYVYLSRCTDLLTVIFVVRASVVQYVVLVS